MAQNNQPVGRGALFKNDKQGIEKKTGLHRHRINFRQRIFCFGMDPGI